MTQLPLSQTSTERYLSVPVVLFKDNERVRQELCLLCPSEKFATLKPKIIEGVKASANSDVRYTYSLNRRSPRFVVDALTTHTLDDDKTPNYYYPALWYSECTIVVIDPAQSKTIVPDTTTVTPDQIRYILENNVDFDGDRRPVPSVVVLGIRCVLTSMGTKTTANLEATCLASDTIRTLREKVWQVVANSKFSQSLFPREDYKICIRSKATPDCAQPGDQVVLNDSDMDKTVSMLSADIVICLVPKPSTTIEFYLRQPMCTQTFRLDLQISDTAQTLYTRVADLLSAQSPSYRTPRPEEFMLVVQDDTRALAIPNDDKTLSDMNILMPSCKLTIVEKEAAIALSGNDKVELRPSNTDDTLIKLRVHKKFSAEESVAQLKELDNEIRDLNEKVRDFVRIEAFLECKKKYAKACEAIRILPAKYLASISADYGGELPKVPSQKTMDLVANAIQDAKAKVEMLSTVSEYKVIMARSDTLWEKLSQYAKDDQLDLAHWGL